MQCARELRPPILDADATLDSLHEAVSLTNCDVNAATSLTYPLKYVAAIELEAWRQKFGLDFAKANAWATLSGDSTAVVGRTNEAEVLPTQDFEGLIPIYTRNEPRLTRMEFEALASRRLHFPPMPFAIDFEATLCEEGDKDTPGECEPTQIPASDATDARTEKKIWKEKYRYSL